MNTSSDRFIGTGGPQQTSLNCNENNVGHSFRLFCALKTKHQK